MSNSYKTPQSWTRATLVCMFIFGTCQITLSLKRQSTILSSKSNGLCIDNGGTKIDPPLNLKSAMQLNPNSKYNQNRTLGKLQNSGIEFGDPSRSKLSLAKIHMRYIAKIIQHMVYINTKGVSCIYCLHSFSHANISTLWTPNSSTTQTPPLCYHFRNL